MTAQPVESLPPEMTAEEREAHVERVFEKLKHKTEYCVDLLVAVSSGLSYEEASRYLAEEFGHKRKPAQDIAADYVKRVNSFGLPFEAASEEARAIVQEGGARFLQFEERERKRLLAERAAPQAPEPVEPVKPATVLPAPAEPKVEAVAPSVVEEVAVEAALPETVEETPPPVEALEEEPALPEAAATPRPEPVSVQADAADEDTGLIHYLAKRLKKQGVGMIGRVQKAVENGSAVTKVFADLSLMDFSAPAERKRRILTRALEHAFPVRA